MLKRHETTRLNSQAVSARYNRPSRITPDAGRLPRILHLGFIIVWALVELVTVPRVHALRYDIEAWLDPHSHQVRGEELILWENSSQQPVRELFMHLYLNAFANAQTVLMQESGRSFRGRSFDDKRGSIRIVKLHIEDDKSKYVPIVNTQLLRQDKTQAHIQLLHPVPSGATVRIYVSFVAQLPAMAMRTGYIHDFHCVTQWYPKLAQLQNDGRWATFPYHGRGEFFSDFADYRVTIHTPATYSVVASGQPSATPLPTAQTYVANRVHDFAWITSSRVQYKDENYKGIALRVAFAPGFEYVVSRHLATLKAGFDHFQQLLVPYPYPNLSLVIPPRGAEGCAGMEYPNLIVSGGSWLPLPAAPLFSAAEHVTAHELAHQWFYGIIASNEVVTPFLDEALSEWLTLDLMRVRRQPAISFLGFRLDAWTLYEHLLNAFHDSLVRGPGWPAHAYPAHQYGIGVYTQGSWLIEQWRRQNPARFNVALQAYAKRFAFKHPDVDDFCVAIFVFLSSKSCKQVLIEGINDDYDKAVIQSYPSASGFRSEVMIRRKAHGGANTLSLKIDDGSIAITLPARTPFVRVSHKGEKPVHQAVLMTERPVQKEPRPQSIAMRLALLAQQLLFGLGL